MTHKMDDPGRHPEFEAFKQRRLANPEVKAAYIEAKVRNLRGCGCPADTPVRQISEYDVQCLGCGYVSA